MAEKNRVISVYVVYYLLQTKTYLFMKYAIHYSLITKAKPDVASQANGLCILLALFVNVVSFESKSSKKTISNSCILQLPFYAHINSNRWEDPQAT